MLNKTQVKNLIKNQKEIERAKNSYLKWYFWNLKQYRNGSWICGKCDMINPKDSTVNKTRVNGVYSNLTYTCPHCFYKHQIGR